jgi:hypothetical protein
VNELFKKPGSATRRSSFTSQHVQRGERTTSVLASCPLGDLVLGLDSRVVEAITDLGPDQVHGEDVLDLAARYGVTLPPSERRRCLSLRRGEQLRSCIVGPEVMVREFHGAPLPLPPFLHGLSQSAALRGYFAWPRGYVFVLDLDSIFDRSSK